MVSLPAVEAVGPVYAACALVPAAAGLVLLAGVYSHTGTLNPGVEGEPADYVRNDSPQPHSLTTFGFSTSNPSPCRPVS